MADDAAEIAQLVATEQLRLQFAYTGAGTLGAAVFAVVLAAHVRGRVDDAWLAAWVVIKLLIAALRMLFARAYARNGRPGGAEWQAWTQALLALDGLCWGIGGAWLVQNSDSELVAVIAASLCCVAALATFGLQVRLAATLAYVLPMLVPAGLSLLARGDRIGLFAGIGYVLLLALLTVAARRSEQRLAEVFRLRFLTSRIAAERAQALELAQRESNIKMRFLATMSHELRTPLHGILGLARLLRGEHADVKLRHQLGLIEHSGEHLLRIVNDLLDLSRAESGRIELRAAPFDLQDELEELVDIYLVRCNQRGLAFKASLDFDGEHSRIGDAVRLRQMLHNLLGNAVKFTEHGEVRFSASCDADGCRFVVADSGPGISAADLPRIFDAFARGRSSGRAAGAGLGLNITRELATAMGGSVSCESQPGRGASFTLTLPLRRGARLDHDAAAGEPAPRQLPTSVLLAEDNDVSALVAQAMLGRHACQVEWVRDGAAAAQAALRAARPDVVLMDCEMPGVDGIEATRRIRAGERSAGLRRVPVVALTANSAPEDRQRCLEAGMDAMLSKPFTEDALLDVLQSALRSMPSP